MHASLLTQVEIHLSVIQRMVSTPIDFADLAEVESRLATFESRHRDTANPYHWTFTSGDLGELSNDRPTRPTTKAVPEEYETGRALGSALRDSVPLRRGVSR